MNTYICYVTLHLRDDARSAALLCYRNRAEIIVLLCNRSPIQYFRFSCQLNSYPVWCEQMQVTGHRSQGQDKLQVTVPGKMVKFNLGLSQMSSMVFLSKNMQLEVAKYCWALATRHSNDNTLLSQAMYKNVKYKNGTKF